jgi:hypothetical protein
MSRWRILDPLTFFLNSESVRTYHFPSEDGFAGQIHPPANQDSQHYLSELRGGAGGALADSIAPRLEIAGPNPGRAPAQANNLYVETLSEVVANVVDSL